MRSRKMCSGYFEVVYYLVEARLQNESCVSRLCLLVLLRNKESSMLQPCLVGLRHNPKISEATAVT